MLASRTMPGGAFRDEETRLGCCRLAEISSGCNNDDSMFSREYVLAWRRVPGGAFLSRSRPGGGIEPLIARVAGTWKGGAGGPSTVGLTASFSEIVEREVGFTELMRSLLVAPISVIRSRVAILALRTLPGGGVTACGGTSRVASACRDPLSCSRNDAVRSSRDGITFDRTSFVEMLALRTMPGGASTNIGVSGFSANWRWILLARGVVGEGTFPEKWRDSRPLPTFCATGVSSTALR